MRHVAIAVILACLQPTIAQADRVDPSGGTSCTRSTETIEGRPADCINCKSFHCTSDIEGRLVCTTTNTKDCEYRDGSPVKSSKVPKATTDGIKK